jgi:hypothetical protein
MMFAFGYGRKGDGKLFTGFEIGGMKVTNRKTIYYPGIYASSVRFNECSAKTHWYPKHWQYLLPEFSFAMCHAYPETGGIGVDLHIYERA